MAKAKMDRYSNRAIERTTMTAVNTITYSQIRFGVGIFQGIALVIHRVEWYPSVGSLRELVAASDQLDFAITSTDGLAVITDILEPSILVLKNLAGLGVNVEFIELPFISDFSKLPGGGLILPPNPLFLCVNTQGAVAASSVGCLIYFTFLELTDKDYIELIQASIPANI